MQHDSQSNDKARYVKTDHTFGNGVSDLFFTQIKNKVNIPMEQYILNVHAV